MHQAQLDPRIYTFIQNDVKIIDVTLEVPYDLNNYLDHSVISNVPQIPGREGRWNDGHAGIWIWSSANGLAAR
ncbi:hypothetical protein [Paenibacillus sp. FSL K6-0108]|uniref:hypothetical protein n=1 Tax=Paenibacillus sp. FSL K6-0108 TaxID=2921417 RepID=UPI00324D3415